MSSGKKMKSVESLNSSRKKAYTAPQLFEYGPLHEITLAFGNHGAVDGGSVTRFMKTKT
jgi:hypothetical protein